MEELMKKSIFVQRESFEDIKFVIKKDYTMSWTYEDYNSLETQKIDLDNATVIKEVTIPMPLLKEKDNFYFEDEHKIVTVKEVMRTDKDSVVYVIEDKITYEPKSLEQYEIDKQKYLDIEKLKKELEKLKKELEKLKKELEKLKEAIRTKNKKKIKELIKD